MSPPAALNGSKSGNDAGKKKAWDVSAQVDLATLSPPAALGLFADKV